MKKQALSLNSSHWCFNPLTNETQLGNIIISYVKGCCIACPYSRIARNTELVTFHSDETMLSRVF
jgi:hypothetical protein